MTNCVFYSLIFVLFLNFTIGSVKYSEVNRVFMSIYKGVFEASTNTIDELGNPIKPYYNKELLNLNLENYFDKNLSKYIKNYEYKIYFFDENKEEICDSNYCRGVNITLKAPINMFYTYEQSQSFTINERK